MSYSSRRGPSKRASQRGLVEGGQAVVTVPKTYPRLGIGVFLGLIAYIRINKLLDFNVGQSFDPD